MYKNAKLYTVNLADVVQATEKGWQAKQTLHYRNGKIQDEPFVERGDIVDAEALEDLANAYRSGRLYFKLD